MARKAWYSLVRAGLLVGVGWAWTESNAPGAGEGLILRWVRVCVSHPVRTAVALFLIDCAITVGPGLGRESTKQPGHARGGGGLKLG